MELIHITMTIVIFLVLFYFLNKTFSNMELIHITMTIVIFLVLFFGKKAWDSYLQNKLEIRRNEIKSLNDKEFLRYCDFITEEDTKKMQMLKDIAEKQNDFIK